MNESFFGQYSVFCVFGSVVGCVVVPLIAQVLQQQSMECVILSAIVLSLTAAHWNKKGGSDAVSSYSKIMSNELDRKKCSHNKKQRNHNQQQQNQQQQQNIQLLSYAEQLQIEVEHVQQRKELKNIEMERRSEEKRLKKLKKREQKLRKREEEDKKQQVLEEQYRSLKTKRLKQQKENYLQSNDKNFMKTAVQNLDKFCGNNAVVKRNGLAVWDANRVHSTNRTRTITSINTPYCQQKIPRFERSRAGSSTSDSIKVSNDDHSMGANTLTIKCNLSASCSSLSSISSLSSGSASPPMSMTSNSGNTPWVMSGKHLEPSTGPLSDSNPPHSNIINCPDNERLLKSYSHNHVMKSSQKLIPHSSSLFCSHLDDKETSRESQPIVGEYSLFGPRPFVTSFAR